MTRPEAATIALFQRGGEHDLVHTEQVAVTVAQVAPGMFSWEKYPEYIDKELVRVALSDARLKKRYVVGSHEQGWMLTPSGVKYAAHANELIGTSGPPAPARRGKADQQTARERTRLLASDAHRKFMANQADAVTDDEADAFFRLNVYVRGQARLRKITRMENEFGDDPELGELVTLLAERSKTRG
jgi:hypothetical protein